MSDKIKIVSDGTARGTFVEFKGERIKGIVAINIQSIEPNCAVRANLEFCDVALNINSEIGGVQCLNKIGEEAIKQALGIDE